MDKYIRKSASQVALFVYQLTCETIHTKSIYLQSYRSWRIVNKRFELLKMNLISPDTLFEICTYIYLINVCVTYTIQPKHQSSTMKSTITQVVLFYKRFVYPFPVIHLLNP